VGALGAGTERFGIIKFGHHAVDDRRLFHSALLAFLMHQFAHLED
jgi:hypothetical protein